MDMSDQIISSLIEELSAIGVRTPAPIFSIYLQPFFFSGHDVQVNTEKTWAYLHIGYELRSVDIRIPDLLQRNENLIEIVSGNAKSIFIPIHINDSYSVLAFYEKILNRLLEYLLPWDLEVIINRRPCRTEDVVTLMIPPGYVRGDDILATERHNVVRAAIHLAIYGLINLMSVDEIEAPTIKPPKPA